MTEFARLGRERLPNRRQNATRTIEWHGSHIHVTAGFASDLRILEVFARASRPESDLDQAADDIAVLISRLLQQGERLSGLARGLGRLPDGSPSSIVGAVVDELLRLERSGI